MTQVKKTYAEITVNRGNTNEQHTNNNDKPIPALKIIGKRSFRTKNADTPHA